MIMVLDNYSLLLDDPLFWFYMATLVVDIITGNIKAWTTSTVDSKVGVRGTLKHFGLLAFVLLFLPNLSIYLGTRVATQGLLTYFIYQYTISIIENLGVLGFDIPQDLAKRFAQIPDKKEGDGNDNGSGTLL